MPRVYDYEGPPRVAHEGHLYLYNVIREGGDYDLDGRVDEDDRLRVLISGGSMGGLFTGLALDEVGHDVEIFERSSSELEDRGAGIIAHPQMFEFLENNDMATRDEIGTYTDTLQHYGTEGVIREEDMRIWTTSWNAVYRCLKDLFPNERYHLGKRVVDVEQDTGSVTIGFEDGGSETGDVMVDAEGYRSDTRQQLLPDLEPEYAGYVAWRGVVTEGDLRDDAEETLGENYTIFHGEDTQILTYPVPGPNGELTKGDRLINWVWYYPTDEGDLDDLLLDNEGRQREHSLPPGLMRDEVRQRQVEIAEADLPELHSYLVSATDDPFIQVIYDLGVPQMVYDRVCILGDAAFFARPHTGSGTAKAAADGLRLGEVLNGYDDLESALAEWEETELALGQRLLAIGKDRGDRYTGQV